VHDLVAAQDGIGRADREAKRAANTPCLINDGYRYGPFGAVIWIERQYWTSSDFGQNGNALKAPRRALIDGGVVLGNGLCVGLAIGKTATCALRLRQRIVDAVSQCDHFLRAGAFLATAFTARLAVGFAADLAATLGAALTAVLAVVFGAAFFLVPKSLCAKMNLTTAG